MVRTDANERSVLAMKFNGSVVSIAFPNIDQAPQTGPGCECRTWDRSEARTESDSEKIENESYDNN